MQLPGAHLRGPQVLGGPSEVAGKLGHALNRGRQLIGVTRPYVAGVLEGADWFDKILPAAPSTPGMFAVARRLRQLRTEMAVLFRAGYMSADLEIELANRKIPFEKWGGLKFLEAAHVKDVLAHLRWLFGVFLPRGLPGFGNLAKFLPPGQSSPLDGSRWLTAQSNSALSWDAIKVLRERWKRKLVLKGVMAVADAAQAAKLGIDGIILSKKAEENNMVNPSAFSNGLSASLCEMADLTKMEVDLAIAEQHRSRLLRWSPEKQRFEDVSVAMGLMRMNATFRSRYSFSSFTNVGRYFLLSGQLVLVTAMTIAFRPL